MDYKKKLIEVALPLDAINKASSREKSIRQGHPATLHLWWARRPLAACRAVLFASLVDDPSSCPDRFPTEEAQSRERQRLFDLIEKLVLWENTNNEEVISAARTEILKSTDGYLPSVYDPFCGGGSIPLEAQRLGLAAYGSDINPVAVLISKAMLEIPSHFDGQAPVNCEARMKIMNFGNYIGSEGLAEDVRFYGHWIRNEAEKRIGHLYPKVQLPIENGGGEATVIAWLWARTVKCPNPACGAETPLVRSFNVSNRKGKKIWVSPLINRQFKTVEFSVHIGTQNGQVESTVNRRGAKCLLCGEPISFEYIRSEGKKERISSKMMAIVAEGNRGRIYISPNQEHVSIANEAEPNWIPSSDMPEQALGFRIQQYGMVKHSHLFTMRQLCALTTFNDLVREAIEKIQVDAIEAGLSNDNVSLEQGGQGAQSYAEAVSIYLGLAASRCANSLCTLAVWSSSRDQSVNVFSRQALPMTWDYPEVNPLAGAAGDYGEIVDSIAKIVSILRTSPASSIVQKAAQEVDEIHYEPVISTDPPYYDNIGYADLSDFFYIWLRSSLASVFPDLFKTMLVPKLEELIANPFRFNGDKDLSRQFFEDGLRKVFCSMNQIANKNYPITIYYAFKQSESDEDSNDNSSMVSSTGWESMLEALLSSGLKICGTWPIRTERPSGVKASVNALASSIVLVCRPRSNEVKCATRREFIKALQYELPESMKNLQHSNIAPVDLAQAAIGPGMAVFTQYEQVIEANGQPMAVRTALQIINRELDAYLSAQESDMDNETRFCLAWYEQYGFSEAASGEADVLVKAKDTVVDRMVSQGILESRRGKTRLISHSEMDDKWFPEEGKEACAWLCTQQLVKRLSEQGEDKTATLASMIPSDKLDLVHNMAYRLFTIAERKGWADEALLYNTLVVSWPVVQEKMVQMDRSSFIQGTL